MPSRRIDRIQQRIRLKEYDMTVHAMDEMAEDDLNILDEEHAIPNGKVARIERGDARGTKCVVEGVAADQRTTIGVVGRFTSPNRYLIITTHEIV